MRVIHYTEGEYLLTRGQLNPNAPDIPSTFCTPAWDSGLTFAGPTTTSASTASSLWHPLQSLFF